MEEEEEEDETEPSPSPSSSSSSSSSSTSSRDISSDSTGTSSSRTSSNSDSTGSFTTSIALSPSTTTAGNHDNTIATTNSSDKPITNNSSSSSSHDIAFMHSTRDLKSTATHLSTTGFPTPTTSFGYTLVVTETITTTSTPVANNGLPFTTRAPDAESNNIDDLRTTYVLQTMSRLVTEYDGLISLRNEYHEQLPTPVKDVTMTRKVQVTARPKTTSTVFIWV